jgi:sugar/nucleoside kinase (ribokinase family)
MRIRHLTWLPSCYTIPGMNSTTRYSGSPILCIGNVSVDIKAFSDEDVSVEAYREGSVDLVPGGVARGMALNLAHLGFKTAILSAVGNDIFGSYLRDGLEKENIDTELLSTSRTRKTALFSVLSSASHPASCVYCTDILGEIAVTKQVNDYIEKKHVSVFVLDSNPTAETLGNIYDLKKKNSDIFIFQNATAPDLAAKSLPWAHLIDLFACNEFEAGAILGTPADPVPETAEKFRSLGFRSFIITFGERGVMVSIGDELWNEPPYTPVRIVDTIGAGDAFASGFLAGYLEGSPVKTCIHYGLSCARETLLTRETVSSLLSREWLRTCTGPLVS